MEKLPCSIFNDVLGPVMRGPSSSHVAGAARIASMIRQSLDAPVKKAIVDFDVNGALAASHTGHGTDMGFASGLLNMELDAPDVAQYEAIAKERGLEIEYRILDYGAEHPGNYRAEVWDQNGNVVHWEAIAVGGGMVEMQKYEGFSVQIAGDFYELLVIADVALGIEEKIEALLPDAEFFQSDQKNDQILYNWKLAVPLTKEVIQAVRDVAGVSQACYLEPVLPTHSSSTCQVPFSTAAALVDYAKEHPMESWEYALEYEACRGGQSREAVYRQMEQILSVMEQAVETGLAGTKYRDRILGEQVSKVAAAEQAGRLIPDGKQELHGRDRSSTDLWLLRMPAGNGHRTGAGAVTSERNGSTGTSGCGSGRCLFRRGSDVFGGSSRMPGRVRCRFRYGSGGTHGDDGRNHRKLYGCGVRRASEYHRACLRSGRKPC